MPIRRGPTDGKRFKRHDLDAKEVAAKRGGAPTLCTPEIIKEIVDALRMGVYFDAACAAAGVTKDTGWNWMKRGRKGEQPFAEFFSLVGKANGEMQKFYNTSIFAHSKKNWQAAAWYLERRFPKRYGRKDQLELSGELDSNVEVSDSSVDLTKLTREEIKIFRALKAKAAGAIKEEDEDAAE